MKEISNRASNEQQLMIRTREKIGRIRKDLLESRGLTRREADAAAKAGIVDSDQRWWWTEEWQKREREAESEIRRGRTKGPFSTSDELIKHLHKSVPRHQAETMKLAYGPRFRAAR